MPTKYLADHENGAIVETLMRDEPDPHVLDIGAIETRRLGQLAPQRSVMLADLTVTAPDSPLMLRAAARLRRYRLPDALERSL